MKVPVSWHCLCGVSVVMEVHASVEGQFRSAWETVHRGEGHGATDAEGARQVRLHEEAEFDALVEESISRRAATH